MKICDFCTVTKVILDYVAESKNINQLDFMYELFKDFIESDAGADFDFDNGQVCRWLNGTAKISTRIIGYYSETGNIEAMAIDVEENILPLLYDRFTAAEEIYHLLMNDTTVSEKIKCELAENYPYGNDIELANFFSRILLFTMNRNFVKHDIKTKELLSAGSLSPCVRDYIYDIVPKPCRHFCGRENELKQIHKLLNENGKVFLHGIAGIGKSELVKMYAQRYKKEYTNILYFRYMGNLKEMIANCDFADDTSENTDSRFDRHNRFLKSLKDDTLIIIDNFDIVPTLESLFDIVMNYRCKILFTTRCRFSEYTEMEITEMPEKDLIALVGRFYDKTEKKLDIVTQIIDEIHGHTLSVELAARLLSSGILRPKKLLAELKKSKSILHTEDKINLIKDSRSTKATYYEHIHRLMYIAGLSGEAGEIMRCMTFIPSSGIQPRLFAKWLDLKNLNTINALIEYGFVQQNEFHKITLHPLIKEITLDDMKPGIVNCKTFLSNIDSEYLLHGIDLPYYRTMFEITENIINIAEKDDAEMYKTFIKDAFAYMEKYAYESGMNLIISELEKYASTIDDKALVFDYKSAYEHICNQDMQKAMEHELQAVDLCDEISNQHLKANIYANMGGLYHATGDVLQAKDFMEKAYSILAENNLQYTGDSIVQICNYANLAANLGEPKKAIQALEKCTEHVIENGSIHAEFLWNMGLIYLQMNDKTNAENKLKQALTIYSEIWQDEPELIEQKICELKETLTAYGINTQNLISGN
ncbi:MAG: Archaeal ATPase [bacterium]|nr:Archaeal ATPase [bacterium]